MKTKKTASCDAVFKPDSYLFFIAAWAAASLAIGTLKGEHETYVSPAL